MFPLDRVSPAAHYIPRLIAAVMRCLLPPFNVSRAMAGNFMEESRCGGATT